MPCSLVQRIMRFGTSIVCTSTVSLSLKHTTAAHSTDIPVCFSHLSARLVKILHMIRWKITRAHARCRVLVQLLQVLLRDLRRALELQNDPVVHLQVLLAHEDGDGA
jgi:hypothetical protein